LRYHLRLPRRKSKSPFFLGSTSTRTRGFCDGGTYRLALPHFPFQFLAPFCRSWSSHEYCSISHLLSRFVVGMLQSPTFETRSSALPPLWPSLRMASTSQDVYNWVLPPDSSSNPRAQSLHTPSSEALSLNDFNFLILPFLHHSAPPPPSSIRSFEG